MIGKRDHHHRLENITITLKQLVPQKNLVRKIDAVTDVDFIYRAVEKLYSENLGRPSIVLVLLFKMALFQYVFGIPSMRRTGHQRNRIQAVWTWEIALCFLFLAIRIFSSFVGNSLNLYARCFNMMCSSFPNYVPEREVGDSSPTFTRASPATFRSGSIPA